MRTRTEFTRGEPFVAPLAVVSGDASGASCRMVMKRARYNQPPGDDAEIAAELDVQYVANIDPADETSPAGFVGVLTGDVTYPLPAGVYVMDARAELDGTPTYTDWVLVKINERVTPNA